MSDLLSVTTRMPNTPKVMAVMHLAWIAGGVALVLGPLAAMLCCGTFLLGFIAAVPLNGDPSAPGGEP